MNKCRSFYIGENSVTNNKEHDTTIFNPSSETKKSLTNEKYKLKENSFYLNKRNFPRSNRIKLQEMIDFYEKRKLEVREEYFNEHKNTEELKHQCETILQSRTITPEEEENLTNRLKSITRRLNKYRFTANQSQRKYTIIINSLKKELYSLK